jgi:hypothetical protein
LLRYSKCNCFNNLFFNFNLKFLETLYQFYRYLDSLRVPKVLFLTISLCWSGHFLKPDPEGRVLLSKEAVGYHMGQVPLWVDMERFVECLDKAPEKDTHLDILVAVDYNLDMELNQFLRELVAYRTASLIVADKEVDWD